MSNRGRSYIAGGGPLPRGLCSWCRREVALRRDGQLREHRVAEGHHNLLCPASGLTVDQAAEKVTQERSRPVPPARTRSADL